MTEQDAAQDAKDLANGKCDRLSAKVESLRGERNRLISKLTENLGNLRDDSAGYVRDCNASQLDDMLRKVIDAQRELMEHVRQYNAHVDGADRSRILTRSIVIA